MPSVRYFTIIAFLLIAQALSAGEFLPTDVRSSILNQQWYADNIGLANAWKIVDRTPDVLVAVIDMDFNLQHSEMSGVYDLTLSRDFSGHDFNRISDWGVDLEHGSMTAGLIAANGLDDSGVTGISKKGRIIALNIPPNLARPGEAPSPAIDLAEVIRYAVDSGAKVINCSIGITQPDAAYVENLREGVRYAFEHDVVIVASAGNSGVNNDKIEFYPANFSREFANVISVGASTRRNEMWPHSQYGKTTVDLFAPGDDMLVIAKEAVYVRSEGTSEAAPVVSGVVALMRQVNPRLSASEIKTILHETSDKFPAFADKSLSGGRVNAAEAVAAATAR